MDISARDGNECLHSFGNTNCYRARDCVWLRENTARLRVIFARDYA